MTISKKMAVLGLASGVAPVFAAAVDVTATVTDIGAQLAPIGLIAMAVLGVFVGLKAFKWVRKALA